jgi:hypothetical protein
MTLPVSGSISLNDVNTELNIAVNTQISLNQSNVRGLFSMASGQISMSDGHGKANEFPFNLVGGTDVNLISQAIAAGWNGVSKIVATLPTGNVIYASSTGTYALTISGSAPNGIRLVNNGTIEGRGGNGGGAAGVITGVGSVAAGAGGTGGTAIYVSTNCSIDNTNGYIYGGGGGGGGGGMVSYGKGGSNGGGSGGGGIGISVGGGQTNSFYVGGYGSGGTLTTIGIGGAGSSANGFAAGAGGNGGTYGTNGNAGVTTSTANAIYIGGAGGLAGSATIGNAYITWINSGIRAGALN